MKITIQITGDTLEDCVLAAEEVARVIGGGCLQGFDENDTGGYHFWQEHEEVDDDSEG